MKVIREALNGALLLEPFQHRDERGDFVKPYHMGQLGNLGIQLAVAEEFFSTSQLGVIRGMHFQAPPHDHQKLIYCITGRVEDVIVDLRRGSPSYGEYASFELSAENRAVLFIPRGFAHGFATLEDQSCLVYKTDAVHHPSSDAGIRWNSFGYRWPFAEPVLSERDEQFPPLPDFPSPFSFQSTPATS